MTNEQILKLAKTCGFDKFQKRKYDGQSDYGIHWECWEEQLLKFARELWAEGFKVGVEYGYDEGWESNNVSTKMNNWSSDDD